MSSKLFSFILVSLKNINTALQKTTLPCTLLLLYKKPEDSLIRLHLLFLSSTLSPSILLRKRKHKSSPEYLKQANMQTSLQQQQQRDTTPLSLWIPDSRATTTTLVTTTSTTHPHCCLRNLCELEMNIHPDTIAALAEDIRLYDLLSAGDESGMRYPPSFLFSSSLVFKDIEDHQNINQRKNQPLKPLKRAKRRTRRKLIRYLYSTVTETESKLETRMETATRDLLDAGVFEIFRPEEWIQGASMGRKFVGVSALLFGMNWFWWMFFRGLGGFGWFFWRWWLGGFRCQQETSRGEGLGVFH